MTGTRIGGDRTPVNFVIRAKFNPNLYTSWFSSVMQVINNITMLAVILTGAALIREREQGTVEHLLGHAGRAGGDHAGEDHRQRPRHPGRRRPVTLLRRPLVAQGPDRRAR